MNTLQKSVPHWFNKHNFGSGFETNNAVLSTSLYNPELLIVGTYNPKTEINISDFFYHRNYFWPTMHNLLVSRNVVSFQKRVYTNPISPSLIEILAICAKAKMTFADLIKNTFHTQAYEYLHGNVAHFNGKDYNLIDDNALAELDNINQVDWSTKDIIDYLRDTPSVVCVRLTRQPTGVWRQQWNSIINSDYGRLIDFGTIHTPSGMGLHEGGITVASALARRWLFHPVESKKLCDEWIHRNQIPVQNFYYDNPPLPIL